MLSISLPVLASKVLSVKGKTVVISTQGLQDKNIGTVYKTFSGPYQSGKIKIEKLGRGKALAKVTSGVVSPGDRLKISDEEITELYKDYRNFGFAGLELIQPAEVTAGGAKFEFDLHTSLALKYQRGNNRLRFEGKFNYASGGGAFARIGSFDSNFLQITGGIHYFITDSIYARGGIGLFIASIDISIPTDSETLNSQLSLLGIPITTGIGYEHTFNSIIIQAELLLNYNYYLTSELGNNSVNLTDQLFYGFAINAGVTF